MRPSSIRPSIIALTTALTLLALAAPPANADVTIVQSRGVDSRVDYQSLTRFGPWDDRNYQLTVEDLKVLSAEEESLENAIPAFYRVELRKLLVDMPDSGPVQYPFSSLPQFFRKYGGYLIDGYLFRGAERRNGVYEVLQVQGLQQARYQNRFLEGEVRVTSPLGAAESAVALNPVNPDLVVAGSNGPLSGQTMHYSSDGGETWSSLTLPLGGECCDPTVAWSSDGAFAYAATLSGSINGVWFYRSSDNGQSWDDLASITPGDPRREFGGGGSDKEYLHVDISPTSPHKDNIYMTWHQGNVMQFARSTDFGDTWTTQSFPGAATGVGSDITTDAAGNIYYFWASFSTQKIWLLKSTDGGVSFGSPIEVADTEGSFGFFIPSQETRRAAVIVTASDSDSSGGPYDGSIYAAWTDSTGPTTGNPADNHARVQVGYSRDGGATWTAVTPHPTGDANTVDRWQVAMDVAPDGSVHVIFNDTRNTGPARNGIDVYYTFSTDGGQTYAPAERLTAETSPNIASGFEFGDYSSLDIVMDQMMAIYTDNRSESGGGGDSRDVYVTGRTLVLADTVFRDGFESGDLTQWDGTGN